MASRPLDNKDVAHVRLPMKNRSGSRLQHPIGEFHDRDSVDAQERTVIYGV